MNLLIKLAIALLYIGYGGFFAIAFLAAFDGVTYDEVKYYMCGLIIVSVICAVIFEIRNRQASSQL